MQTQPVCALRDPFALEVLAVLRLHEQYCTFIQSFEQAMVGVGRINRVCLCGSIDFKRVRIERTDSSPYVTEFIECERCCVMYHCPAQPDPPKPPPYHGPLILGRERHPHAAPQDEALMAAVKDANKSKPRGHR